MLHQPQIQYPPPLSPALSPSPSTNFRRRQDAGENRAESAMSLRTELTFQRIATSLNHQFGLNFNRHHRRPFPPSPLNNIISIYHKSMADQSKENDSKPESLNPTACKSREEQDEESEKKSTPAVVPPPPEKPLPGDCCGSGCVRCVWDVYYEELDEYNRLYKKDSTKPS